MADVWFRTSTNQVTSLISPTATNTRAEMITDGSVTQDIAINAAPLAIATTQSSTFNKTVADPSIDPNLSALTNNLQAQVGGLVQAISMFNQLQSTPPVSSESTLLKLSASQGGGVVVGVSSNVSGMVGAMKLFDPNGCPVVASPEIGGIINRNLHTNQIVESYLNNGILASGK
jgi:hypothetical protein